MITPVLGAYVAGPAIRAYVEADWPAICRVHDAARLDELRGSVGVEAFASLEATAEGEDLFGGDLWVATVDGHVAGFAAYVDGELGWLYVDPAHYRRGVGRALVRHVLAGAAGERVETTVLDGNPAAPALYLAEGFDVVETRTGRLAGNETYQAIGHIMEWRRA